MEKLPHFVPFPTPNIRLRLVPEEWTACLDAWLTLASTALRFPEAKFQSLVSNDKLGVISFLVSYVQEHAQSYPNPILPGTEPSRSLHKLVYFLSHRFLSLPSQPSKFLHWEFLTDFSYVFQSIPSISKLFERLWSKHYARLEETFQEVKSKLIREAESSLVDNTVSVLRKILPLFHFSPQTAVFFAVGSDLIDSITSGFPQLSDELQRPLTISVYLLLFSLVLIPKRNLSLLSEHLYSLKANAKLCQSQNRPSLLASIVSNTPLVSRLSTMSESGSDTDLSSAPLPHREMSAGLLEFQTQPRWTRNRVSKLSKGKTRAAVNEALDAVHIHRMSMIAQVQDLFPDLGSGFIARLLDEYNENLEEVTAHLLDESLPPYLADADKSEQLGISDNLTVEAMDTSQVMVPRSTPPLSARRNMYDEDELDSLALDASRLHIGKAERSLTTDDTVWSEKSNKAAILAALAQFDSDDDERDDTYDAEDVGGTVDNSLDTDRDNNKLAGDDNAERVLYQLWKGDRNAFSRDSFTRNSRARTTLKQQTGWTDEAIEGWAIMLEREPTRERLLERRFSDMWRGEQRVIERTGWQVDEEDEGDSAGRSHSSSQRGRGRGGFRGGSGRSTSGPHDEKSTQRARRGKEVRGNHARRDGRAKKMARGMGP